MEQTDRAPSTPYQSSGAAAAIYIVAFVVGTIVMSFEMLGSRYLNPYFGSGIYTWAALISTVLAALTLGYFLGGYLADRKPSPVVLGLTVLIGSIYVLLLPQFAEPMLEWVLAGIDDIKTGSMVASLAILLFPVTFLGMYSPFAIRLLIRSAQSSGTVSGTVYGVSTVGSIVGTLGTTFYVLPYMGTRALTLTLGSAGVAAALTLFTLPWLTRRAALALVTLAAFWALGSNGAAAQERPTDLIDEQIRAAMLKHRDGRVARVETEYNDIFVTKRRAELTMSFQLKGWDYTESIANLNDVDDLPVHYTRSMTTALAYPPEPKTMLMIGLGGGSLSTYIGRAMPEVTIDNVEIDPGVIAVAKKYFGVRETPRIRFIAGDGRVFLNRSKERYDLILLDAYRGGYVPFHLLTKEFYTLVKQRLTPGGAAAFNVHDGTKLYHSTVKTLADVFPIVDLYPSGVGEVIMTVSPDAGFDRAALAARAAALQERYKFRFPLPVLLKKRMNDPMAEAKDGVLVTDDFAPVNLYDTIGKPTPKPKRQ